MRIDNLKIAELTCKSGVKIQTRNLKTWKVSKRCYISLKVLAGSKRNAWQLQVRSWSFDPKIQLTMMRWLGMT